MGDWEDLLLCLSAGHQNFMVRNLYLIFFLDQTIEVSALERERERGQHNNENNIPVLVY